MFDAYFIKNGLNQIDGIGFDGVKIQLKENDFDLGFIYSKKPMQVASVFTDNKFQASPLVHFKQYPKNFKSNFLLVNSKNANALTGNKGLEDIDDIFSYLNKLYPDIKNPIMSSTGVIGQRLDIDKIKTGIKSFNLENKNMSNFQKSILTTDKFEKNLSLKVEFEGGYFHISAVAKGAGMINPSLATMLCFITTDANIPQGDMQDILQNASNESFNKISVDGDTSTNDTLMLLSTNTNAYNKEAFIFAINEICKKISLLMLKDGEGSTKVVAFEIKGAKNNTQAKTIAKKLSNSLLVKTALFGCDPNWGRIASTIGSSGAECYEDKLSISYDSILVYKNGENIFTKEVEEKAFKVLSKNEFKIICDLGIANGEYTAFGCDLSYQYVKINAEYRS